MYTIVNNFDIFPKNIFKKNEIKENTLYTSVDRKYIECFLQSATIIEGYLFYFEEPQTLDITQLTYVNINDIDGYLVLLLKYENNYYIVKYARFDTNCSFCKLSKNQNINNVYQDFFHFTYQEGDNYTEIKNANFIVFLT